MRFLCEKSNVMIHCMFELVVGFWGQEEGEERRWRARGGGEEEGGGRG